jgi:DNA-binding transcriptional ArsR family regulator
MQAAYERHGAAARADDRPVPVPAAGSFCRFSRRFLLPNVRENLIIRDMSDIQPRDYLLGDELAVDTPERLKAIADPLRSAIVDLVLERAMTVTELADRLDRPRGTVAYHVDVLVTAGLLQVVRTRKVRAIHERFYGRTAVTYVFPHAHGGEVPFVRDVLAEYDLERAAQDATPGCSTYRHARIPAERADEFGRRLLDLALDFVAEPRGGDTEYGLYLALFPTNRTLAPKPPRSGRDSA